MNIEEVCLQTTNKRVKPRFRSLHRTIDTSVPHKRREATHEMQTLDISKTASFFRENRLGTDWKSKRPNKVQVKKLPSLGDVEMKTNLHQSPYERANTTRSIKAEKNYQMVHHKKLVIN